MRRIVLPLAVALTVTFAGCAGGGSVLAVNGNNPDVVIITNGQNQGGLTPTGLLSVRQNSSLLLHAQAVINGSNANGVVNKGFTWSAGYTTSGVYQTNASGVQGNCAPLQSIPNPQTTPATAPANVGVVIPATSVRPLPEDSSYATFTPPILPPLPSTQAYTAFGGNPAGSFCATIVATTTDGKALGTVNVLVTP